MIKKLTSSLAMLALVLTAAPVAFAGSISVSNTNDAEVSNAVVVSSNSGGNTSTGGRAARGGEGGDVSGADGSSNTAGDGGNGGSGGSGGDVTTGTAISTAVLWTEANTTDTYIEDNDSEDEYNETLSVSSRRGSSGSASYEVDHEQGGSESGSCEAEASSSSSDSDSEWDEYASDEDAESGNSGSESASSESEWSNESCEFESEGGESYSESGSVTAEEHDDLDLEYTRTYVGDDDDIALSNNGTASVENAVVVAANSGDNATRGGRAGAGEDGGNVSGSDDDASNSAGDGGTGGTGGEGGEIRTGTSDSLAEITTVTGRTMTRIIRN